jgi:hypothetical protein
MMPAEKVAMPFPGWTAPAGMETGPRIAWAQFYRRAWAEYRISPKEYRALYLAQLGRCFVCQKAKGIHPDDPKGRGSRRLGVDHNHLIAGRGAVRALLCTGSLSADTCNRLIGRYSYEELRRAMIVLSEPPAQILLRVLDDESVQTDEEITGYLT